MNNKPKVLYISYDGMTDPLGQSQVLPYLSRLSKDFDFHILSSEKEENFSKRKEIISDICKTYSISWTPIQYTKKPPVLSTLKDIRKLRKTAFSLYSKNNFDIIHCRSYIPAIVGLEMKRKFNTKFVFDMRGFWADERIDGNIWTLSNPIFKTIYNFFKKKELQFFSEADYTISLTECGKNEIQSWDSLKGKYAPIEVIPCCADLDHFSSKNINQNLVVDFQKKLNLSDDDFVLSYLGSIGTWYMLDEMLDFFKILLENKPNSKFLFITADNENGIFHKAESKGINRQNIRVIQGERKNLPSLISLSDVSIFFIKPAYSKKASSPTKQAELLGLGIPIICNGNVGDTGDIIEKNNAGFVIDSFSTNKYAEIIDSIENITSISPLHLRKVAESYASLELGIKRYTHVYEKVLK